MAYWNGNNFVFPRANYSAPQTPQPVQSVPTAIPSTPSVLPSVDRGLLGGQQDAAPETTSTPTDGLGIADVNSGLIGNMGTIGSAIGFAAPVPGLGALATLGQTALQEAGYINDMPGLSFDPSMASAMLNAASFGLFGQSIHDQARDAVRGNAERNGAAGAKNAFGGVNIGRDTKQAKEQGRGGAAPSGPDPAMGGMGGIGAAMGGRRGDGLRG